MIHLKDYNINKNDFPYIFIILIFSLFTMLKMLDYHMSGGIFNHDKSVYLINALVFAGMDYHNISYPQDLFFSPLISFLTSLLFRLGLVSKLSIFIVTGIFGLFGNIGLYTLLKNRFNSLLSLTGAIIFGSLSIILLNLSSGLLDLPGVVISIWILVFSIIAINKNNKYFIIIFPLFVLGFFTRYTVGLMLPVILIYYLLNRNFIILLDNLISDRDLFKKKCYNYLKSDEFKYILISLCIGIVLIIFFCELILNYGGSLNFIDQSVTTFKGSKFNPNQLDASDDKLYYLKNIVVVLFREGRPFDSILTYLLCLIAIFGISLNFINLFKNRNNICTNKNDLIFKTNNIEKIFLLISILSLIGAFVGFKVLSNQLITNIFLLIFLSILFTLIQKYNFEKEKLLFDLLIISWFLVNVVFFSLYPIKVPRYAMPFIPAFVIFVIYGLNYILRIFKYKSYENTQKVNLKIINLIPLLLIVIFLISTITFIMPLSIGEYGNDLVDVTDFIKENDSNYSSKLILSEWHNYRTVKWYLNKDVEVIEDNNLDLIDSLNFDYIILQDKTSFKNYKMIFHSGRFYLYSHV